MKKIATVLKESALNSLKQEYMDGKIKLNENPMRK
jgi:hypothetical protein